MPEPGKESLMQQLDIREGLEDLVFQPVSRIPRPLTGTSKPNHELMTRIKKAMGKQPAVLSVACGERGSGITISCQRSQFDVDNVVPPLYHLVPPGVEYVCTWGILNL